jgi:hypothetical protein
MGGGDGRGDWVRDGGMSARQIVETLMSQGTGVLQGMARVPTRDDSCDISRHIRGVLQFDMKSIVT